MTSVKLQKGELKQLASVKLRKRRIRIISINYVEENGSYVEGKENQHLLY